MKKLSFLTCLGCFLFTSVASADITVNPIADTYVDSNNANSNFGALDFFVTNDNGSRDRFSLIRFDISSFSGTLTGAQLGLYDDIGNASETYDIYGLNESADTWTESLTHNQAVAAGLADTSIVGGFVTSNAFGGAPLTSFTDPAGDGTAHDAFNVTSGSIFNFLNADTDGLVSFVIVEPGAADVPGTGFSSRESTTASNRPLLTLTAAAVPEPSCSFTLLSLGLIAMIRRNRRS